MCCSHLSFFSVFYSHFDTLVNENIILELLLVYRNNLIFAYRLCVHKPYYTNLLAVIDVCVSVCLSWECFLYQITSSVNRNSFAFSFLMYECF